MYFGTNHITKKRFYFDYQQVVFWSRSFHRCRKVFNIGGRGGGGKIQNIEEGGGSGEGRVCVCVWGGGTFRWL